MKIFITGGTGFIGQHTIKKLLDGKHQLLILSRNANSVSAKSKVSFIQGDLSNVNNWKDKLAIFRPQAALHLAWEGIPDYGMETSWKNLKQSVALFNLLVELGCKKIVVAGSSWECGGITAIGKVIESDGFKPNNPFTSAKTAIHFFGSQIAKDKKIDFTWARFFYVYGPGQKSASLIPHLILSSQKGVYPELKNPNGGNDFVFVEDVARALKMILEKNFSSADVRIYNIGSGKMTGVQEIANKIFPNKKIKAKKIEGFYADISKVKKEIGWAPEIKIDEGIKKTVEYFKNL